MCEGILVNHIVLLPEQSLILRVLFSESEDDLQKEITKDSEAVRRTIRIPKRKSLGPLTIRSSLFVKSEDRKACQSEQVGHFNCHAYIIVLRKVVIPFD